MVWLATLIIFLMFPACAFGSEGGHGAYSVITNIALCIVAAAVLGILMKLLRQPLILGHILAGVVIGPVGLALIHTYADIIVIAEIGLILLLFMIGLEIDLRKMLAAGRLVIVPGLLQVPVCFGLGYGCFWLLEKVGIAAEPGSFARLYTAVAIAISSTMIVVKLLYEKFELDTLAGRITLGILVFQDIWAIIFLALQPNLSDPKLGSLAQTFMAGALLIAGAFLISKYVLPHVFRSAAKLPELMLLISLGWCFLVSLIAAYPRVGLSMEMGALIAGVSLATFPYNLNVIAKVLSLRDFFVTLFFVALGMQIPVPTGGVLAVAVSITLAALLVRCFGIFGVLSSMKVGHRVATLATINLGQISEFSLVILSLGIMFGHITSATLTPMIWVFSLLAILSTYTIMYSHSLQAVLCRFLAKWGWPGAAGCAEATVSAQDHPIVILGFYRIASAFLDDVSRRCPELLGQIKVVDFNPLVRQQLDKMGVACVYGDISHLDTLHHADIHRAKVVLCSIPDPILKGTSNAKLLGVVRSLCPEARIIVTAEMPGQAQELYRAGADYVLQVSALGGEKALEAVQAALREDIESLQRSEEEILAARREILAR